MDAPSIEPVLFLSRVHHAFSIIAAYLCESLAGNNALINSLYEMLPSLSTS